MTGYRQNGAKFIPIVFPSRLTFNNYLELTLFSFILIIKFFFIHKKFIPKGNKIIIYASSDLYWETIPDYFLKLKYPHQITWIQPIFHIYPHWKNRPGSVFNSIFGYYIQKISHQLIKQKADIVFTINELTTAQLISQGFDQTKIHQTKIGIDLPRNTLKDIKYDGIFIGRLDPTKGIFDIIKITQIIVASCPNFKIVMVGNGNANVVETFKKEIVKQSLQNNIILTGFVTEAEKAKLLSQSRLFIFPSHEEGWGIVIAEAMSHKLPVLTWNLPVYSYVYPHQLVTSPENDIAKFSANIIQYLDDAKLLRTKGQANYDFIKSNYSWKKIADDEMAIISKKT